VPQPVLRYAGAVLALAVVAAIHYLCIHAFGFRGPYLSGVFILLYFLVILGSAWQGFGPGVLVAILETVALPYVVATHQPVQFSAFRVAIVVLASLLISWLGESRRRTEARLRREAGDLQLRVQEQTHESVRAAHARQEAEDRLRFVLDSAKIGYWDFDVEKNVTTRSLRHDQIFGYREPAGTWDYKIFLRHVHPDDREMVDARFQEAMATGQQTAEFRIIWPDYSVHWIWEQSRVERGASGQPVHLSGVIVDITDRKQTEDSLREQAQLLDLAHDAVLSIDWNGTIRFWNRGAEQMYGWTRAEALGKISHNLLQTRFPEPLQQITGRLASQGHWEGDLVQTRRDGSQLHLASRWALRLSAAGEPAGYLEINTDVTERRHIEEQLQHTQKLESLGILAGGVAHDFNNLLTGIMGNASLLLDSTAIQSPNRRLLDEVVKAAERAADLTRQLLAYAGKGRFVMKTVSFSDLVREISGLIQTSIPKHVQLRLQLADDLPGVEADPGQLQQIVMNLVINGAEAIAPEGGSVLVRTGVQQVDQDYIQTISSAGELLRPGAYVSLEVHDTGSGMSEATIARIFDPFFTTKFTGRGLGLSAVLGIVRAHRGALKVYSQPGRGSTFKLLFPASANPSAGLPIAPQRDLAGAGTVIVVDDEEIVRQTAKHTLERYGYQALTAEDGERAVELYRQATGVVLVLLDLTMPVMNGEEALRRLQTIDPKVKVLLSSGYNEVEAVQRFAGKGLAGFIQKPYTASALAEKVKEVLTG
jgi:two-component system cell cycle sensor histidine kinase/response regulator CckA